MFKTNKVLRWKLPLTGLLMAAMAGGAHAQAAQAPVTLELATTHGKLTAGLPDADAVNGRGTWILSGGDVLRAELLDERKFGARGGIVAVSWTHNLSPDWYATGTLAAGHGGPNWANERVDIDVAAKWGASKGIVTHAAFYGARYDGHRSDRGLRLSLVAYLPASLVLEGGVTLNVSNPGTVHSQMPFASATWGRSGEQYLSLRVSSGTEAYQALGAGQQLVNFRSHSAGLTWRRWISKDWGFTATAEAYRNPTYRRDSVGAGLFAQF